MAYQDKTLTCVECGRDFTFTAREQEFFAEKGFTNEPKRCPECRRSRKQQRDNEGYGRAPRRMYPAICAACGKETEVPFEPREGRPVYCNDCYAKMRDQGKI
ncbi:MAG: zinc-ribbon domain containing protein [Dehalococcoidales bacterium]|nr:zinc-ribbon domain containing protein [Dehalococcoidales bacterium]